MVADRGYAAYSAGSLAGAFAGIPAGRLLRRLARAR